MTPNISQNMTSCYEIIRATGMIASSSTFHPNPGRVIRDLLIAVYGIVLKH